MNYLQRVLSPHFIKPTIAHFCMKDKNKYEKNENDKWVTLIGLSILLLLQLVNEKGIELPKTKMQVLFTAYGFATIIIVWLIILWIVKKARASYPSVSQSRKRLSVAVLISLPVIFCLNLAIMYNGLLPEMPSISSLTFLALFRHFMGIGLMIWIIAGMYEAGYYHHLLRQAQKERNDLLYLQRLIQSINRRKQRGQASFGNIVCRITGIK